MNNITLIYPSKIVFGKGVFKQLHEDLGDAKKVLFLVAKPLKDYVCSQWLSLSEAQSRDLRLRGNDIVFWEYNFSEPTITYFNTLLAETRNYAPDCIVGVGGGSVLDTAKLLAALYASEQSINEVFGKNLLKGRNCRLICVPSTSGTGSEVSPNAILLDEVSDEKKGVISPFLLPDACYIDPLLMLGLPPKITAETAMDALSHCIEAFTNKFSHPVVDNYALAGIKLITSALEAAYRNGQDVDARSALALGSMYGGLCLGPVNTAAVHALSYGLGGKYHISHGLANAVLLPEVMRFNLPACPEKYAEIAKAIGAKSAEEGIDRIQTLAENCGIPRRLSEIGINASEIPTMADLAMKVTRLLVNNPRELTFSDAVEIFQKMF